MPMSGDERKGPSLPPDPRQHDPRAPESAGSGSDPNPDAGSDSAGAQARVQVARLRWRCRRGMKELDVVLERYLQQRYPSAPAAEQQAFQALLDLPDPQLLALVMQRDVPADPEWVHVIAKLIDADD